eukprot:jgi/Tetstr1/433074/TSEL_022408.t1
MLSGRVGAKSASAEDDYLAVPKLLHRAESGNDAVRPVSRAHGLFLLGTDLTNEYLEKDDRRLPAHEEYLWDAGVAVGVAAVAGVAAKVSTSDGVLGQLSSELLALCEATFR